MKRTRKITSIILAALMVLSALVVSAGGRFGSNIVRFRGVL